MTEPAEFVFKRPNKYRRAFDWRVSQADDRSLGVSTEALVRLYRSEFLDLLDDFLDLSRRRQNNRTSLARLQIWLLQELTGQEAGIKHYRDALRTAREKQSADSANELHTDEIRFYERELFFHRAYANAIRVIGDGLAWRALGFDRAVPRLLSQRATKQNVMSEGLLAELLEWSRTFDQGSGIAIFNSLTNCLAFGDVTLIRPDNSVEIIEVKSSNTKSGRKVRQRQAMREIVTILESGGGRVEDREVEIEILPIRPETGLDQIEELLKEAGKSGWSAKKVSNSLYVQAIDFQKFDDVESTKTKMKYAKKEVVEAWEANGDYVMDMRSLDTISFNPNCAPFSIFPFSSRTCVELIVGAKMFTTYLNIDGVAREFEYRGWNIDKTTQQLMAEGNRGSVLNVSKRDPHGTFYARIPPADFMRLQMEALRPQTLMNSLEIKFKEAGRGSEGYLLSLFSGESELWR